MRRGGVNMMEERRGKRGGEQGGRGEKVRREGKVVRRRG